MHNSFRYALAVFLIAGHCLYVGAAPTQLYIADVDIFDGHSATLLENRYMLVEGNLISRIETEEISDLSPDALRIDGGGRVMTPGLIDTHSHLAIVDTLDRMRHWSWERIGVLMGKRAETTLLWGFTTVRDLGVIETGAYADLLLVDGDPLADITLFSEPEKNLRLIVRDGVVHKNTLPR